MGAVLPTEVEAELEFLAVQVEVVRLHSPQPRERGIERATDPAAGSVSLALPIAPSPHAMVRGPGIERSLRMKRVQEAGRGVSLFRPIVAVPWAWPRPRA